MSDWDRWGKDGGVCVCAVDCERAQQKSRATREAYSGKDIVLFFPSCWCFYSLPFFFWITWVKPPGVLSFLPTVFLFSCLHFAERCCPWLCARSPWKPCPARIWEEIFFLFLLSLYLVLTLCFLWCVSVCVSVFPTALTGCLCVFSSYRRRENVQLQLELKESHNMQLVFITSPLVHWSIITFWLHLNLSMTSAVLSDTLAGPRTHSLAHTRNALLDGDVWLPPCIASQDTTCGCTHMLKGMKTVPPTDTET